MLDRTNLVKTSKSIVSEKSIPPAQGVFRPDSDYIQWGLPTLDAMTGGFESGTLTALWQPLEHAYEWFYTLSLNFAIHQNLQTSIFIPDSDHWGALIPALTRRLSGLCENPCLEHSSPEEREVYFKARKEIRDAKLDIYENYLTVEEVELGLDKLLEREKEQPEIVIVNCLEPFETEMYVHDLSHIYGKLMSLLKTFSEKSGAAVLILATSLPTIEAASLKHIDTLLELSYLPWEFWCTYCGPKPKEEHFFEIKMSCRSRGLAGNAPIRLLFDKYGMKEGPWGWSKESLLS